MPGVFFKFDMSSMMVLINEERKPFWQFLVRLSGIIGGIFATSGMLHTLFGSFTDGVLCKLFRQEKKKESGTLNDSNDSVDETVSDR